MADIQEIQEYLWKNLIFHNYSLTKEKKQKQIAMCAWTSGTVLQNSAWPSFYWAVWVLPFLHLHWSLNVYFETKFAWDTPSTPVCQCVRVPAGRAPDLASSAPGLWEPSFLHVLKGSQVALCSSLAGGGLKYHLKYVYGREILQNIATFIDYFNLNHLSRLKKGL